MLKKYYYEKNNGLRLIYSIEKTIKEIFFAPLPVLKMISVLIYSMLSLVLLIQKI